MLPSRTCASGRHRGFLGGHTSNSIDFVDVILASTASPRYASRVILLHVVFEYSADVVNLQRIPQREKHVSVEEQPWILTFLSEPRPVVTKDCNETTIAPSFISKNFGLIASLTMKIIFVSASRTHYPHIQKMKILTTAFEHFIINEHNVCFCDQFVHPRAPQHIPFF